jgi:uroporphyrin-III C-methyltransferase
VNQINSSVGKIYLVGAGPGDPDLLTLKAVKAIAAAQVILVDDLVNPAILEHASPTSRVIYVGKRGGCQSTPQEFIDRLMVAQALAGHVVVRLKGGDPMLFGRSAEELAAARAAGVAIEVVNGITSALATSSALGAPLTNRDCAQGVVFVTGHIKASGQEPDWAALAKSGLTLVIYMGVANAELIQRRLLDGGLPGTTPVAVVQQASTSAQMKVVSTLNDFVSAIRSDGLLSPSVIVVGEAMRMAADAIESTLIKSANELNSQPNACLRNSSLPLQNQSAGLRPRQRRRAH